MILPLYKFERWATLDMVKKMFTEELGETIASKLELRPYLNNYLIVLPPAGCERRVQEVINRVMPLQQQGTITILKDVSVSTNF